MNRAGKPRPLAVDSPMQAISLLEHKQGSYSWYEWVLGSDDRLIFSNGVLFGDNQLRGDVSELPEYIVSVEAYLPKMIISDFIEDSGDATYYNGIRNDFQGTLDLLRYSQYYLTANHGFHDYWAYGADQNTDGRVELIDLVIMLYSWDPNSDYLNEEGLQF